LKKALHHTILATCFILLSGNHQLFSQQLSNLRVKTIPVSNDTIHIDSLSIIPGSVIIEDGTTRSVVDAAAYQVDEFHALVIWKSKPLPDSISVTYRVFPLAFTKAVFHKDFSRFNKQDSIGRLPIIYSLQELNPNAAIDLGNMDYNGSFSRGISFGNSQDLVVNSSFNLQLQGKLAGDVDVLAALSDNNIPIQPEGNTQQIQEFDKIFIQLKKNKSSLVVGDYELARPEGGYFMNFYKKLQGADFTSMYDGGKDLQLKSAASIALAKGKYAKNTFTGQEGNQGPYRLTGNNGETFIIILAGTERVYIDGQIMVRGADRDYVIDYNAGEIIFTPIRLITKDKRIEIEFQYSEKAYLRTIFFAGQQFHEEKWNVHAYFYSEQDAKNQPIQQELSDSQKVILSDVGDSIQNAHYQSIDSIGYTPDRILYKKTDSLGITIYVYSTNPDSAKYALNFSYVGPDHGNYVIASTLVNGRVYRWVAPVDGVPQGDYEPVIPLIAPQRIQLLAVGADYQFSANSLLSWEGSLSNQDVNTFSSLSNKDNTGVGTHVAFNQTLHLNHSKEKPTDLFMNAQYEFAGRTFKPVERYRPVEFERDWNIYGTVVPANENLAAINLNLQQSATGNIQYGFSFFDRAGIYSGLRNALNGNYQYHGFKVTLISSYLTSNDSLNETKFFRPAVDVSQSFKFLKGSVIGIHGEQENDKIFSKQADTLTSTSFYWNEGRIYFRSNDTAKIRIGLDYASRVDYAPTEKQFKELSTGNTANITAEFLRNPASILRWTLTYRKLDIKDTSLTALRPDESLLGRVSYDLQMKKGFIVSNTLYEIGSVQEQKQEFAYTKVPDGTGVYIWIDYNGDGVQQINEFEVAAFQSEANYIKVLLPTNQFVKAYSVLFNQSLSINPKSLWNTDAGLKGFINRFSALATLQINKKTLRGNFGSQFNPFFLEIADSILLSTNSLVSGFLYFNKTNPKYGIDYFYQNNRSKNLLTSGVEVRTFRDTGIRFRWNISRKFSTIVKVDKTDKGYSAELVSQNNYLIMGYATEPQFTYQPSSIFRISLGYKYADNKNETGEVGERGINNNIVVNLRYNVIAKSVVNVDATYANVNYTGAPNTPVQYAMLEGLQPGQNYLLTVSFERKLSNVIELSLSYEGRKTGDNDLVNTGRAQIRALF